MNTTTLPAAVAEPASSHRDDPGTPHNCSERHPEDGPGEAGSADGEPPEPARSNQPLDDEPRASGSARHDSDVTDADRSITRESPRDSDIDITIDAAEDVAHEIDFLWLDGHLRSIAIHLPLPIERVSIRIVGDSEMTELNRRFHGADDTTDVLTFCESETGDSVDADLALGADEAGRQASSRGHGIERELLLYALHGLLHCCGFNDADEESFVAMHAEEDRILNAIGVGATFADDADELTREQQP